MVSASTKNGALSPGIQSVIADPRVIGSTEVKSDHKEKRIREHLRGSWRRWTLEKDEVVGNRGNDDGYSN
jgi:hypothetical protein